MAQNEQSQRAAADREIKSDTQGKGKRTGGEHAPVLFSEANDLFLAPIGGDDPHDAPRLDYTRLVATLCRPTRGGSSDVCEFPLLRERVNDVSGESAYGVPRQERLQWA